MRLGELWTSPRGETERLVFALREYEGKRFFELRIYWRNGTGEWLPSKKGITIRLGEVRAFGRALIDAVKAMPEQGGGAGAR